jgi:hypothetical protein
VSRGVNKDGLHDLSSFLSQFHVVLHHHILLAAVVPFPVISAGVPFPVISAGVPFPVISAGVPFPVILLVLSVLLSSSLVYSKTEDYLL